MALITTMVAVECIGFSEIAVQRYNFSIDTTSICRFFRTFVP